MKRIINLLLVGSLLTLSGCAWISAHKQPITTTGAIIGKRVFIIASKVAIDTVLASRNPDESRDWLEYASADLNSQKWSAINSADVMAIANAWRSTAPQLDPVADNFTKLWDKMNPKTEEEVKAFMRAYSASLLAPREAVTL